MKCPTKQQDNRQQDERCENADKRCKTCREDWKKAQDRPQFSNRINKCLNCAGDHGTHDCPTRQQPHTPPLGNPANSTGIYKNNSQSQNHLPQQHSQQSASMMDISTPTLMVNNPLQMGPQQGQQQHPSPQIPPVNQNANSPIRHNQLNQPFQQPPMPQVSPLMAPLQQYNPQIPPPYFHHYPPTNSPPVDSNESLLARVFHRQMDMAEDKKSMTRREEREKHKEEHENQEKREANQRAHINKTFKKIECFDGSNPNRCLSWLEQIHTMSNNYNRDYHEELLLNSGGSITKTIHNIDVNASVEQIKDIILHNHSNLRTPSQRLHTFNSIQQKPDEALQTYNSQYESHFQLAYPDITIDDTGSRTQCIHYASSPHSKLGDEMEGRCNQDLPEFLQAALRKQ